MEACWQDSQPALHPTSVMEVLQKPTANCLENILFDDEKFINQSCSQRSNEEIHKYKGKSVEF